MHRPTPTTRFTSPVVLLAAALAIACATAVPPAGWVAPAKSNAMLVLRPGQQATSVAREQTGRAVDWLQAQWQSSGEVAAAERELDRLRRENAKLLAERDSLRAQVSASTKQDDDRLLHARTITARLLGSQARAWLVRNRLLDAGSEKGVEPGALVLDRPLLDAGADAALAPGQLVLAGRCVVGKIAETGDHTSTVRTITEPGYRDLVRIGHPDGPQGMLEGTGDPLARVRLVDVTSPVAEGDPVFSSAGEGVLRVPPLCGRIARLSRPAGETHWEIHVAPVGPPDCPERVAVLKTQINVNRIGTLQRDEETLE